MYNHHNQENSVSWIKPDPLNNFKRESIVDEEGVSDPASIDLDHSVLIDIQRWSDHPEAKSLISRLETHFPYRLSRKERDYLRRIVLNLYNAWKHDPSLVVAYDRGNNHYVIDTRYNKLHIKRPLVKFIDQAINTGLIGGKQGFFDKRPSGKSRKSRICSTKLLKIYFKEIAYYIDDFGRHPDVEVIILKGEKEAGQPYPLLAYEDSPQTCLQRKIVTDYNSLLQATSVRVEGYPTIIRYQSSEVFDVALPCTPARKPVHRSFNRGSFSLGGRFYGAWWQSLPQRLRKLILIQDEPTVEIDYCNLHIVLLYAELGINYHRDIDDDSYAVDLHDLIPDLGLARACVKRLLLILLNANSEHGSIKAFTESKDNQSNLTFEQVEEIVDRIKEKHRPISDSLGKDVGIRLQNVDARITERIIVHCLERRLPVLTIHDSYIVRRSDRDELVWAMEEAFETVTGVASPQLKIVEGDGETVLRHAVGHPPSSRLNRTDLDIPFTS